jgi:hypothetical protein
MRCKVRRLGAQRGDPIQQPKPRSRTLGSQSAYIDWVRIECIDQLNRAKFDSLLTRALAAAGDLGGGSTVDQHGARVEPHRRELTESLRQC